MKFKEFNQSLDNPNPPAELNPYALAMWNDAKGDWEKAHKIVQDLPGPIAAWIHAYLHRKEGDAGNAGYWYRLAGRKMPAHSLPDEWEEIVKAVL